MIRMALIFVCAGITVKAVDMERMALCIAQVEGATVMSIGSSGERGPWQITRTVWRQHSSAPHGWASDGLKQGEARRVVVEHLTWLENNLDNPTEYRIALAWNAGIGATNRCRVNARQADYARRVVNLYEASRP